MPDDDFIEDDIGIAAMLPPVEEVELIILVLDGSGSMKWKKTTHDGQSKVHHLMEILDGFLARVRNSENSGRYRIAPIYFATKIFTESNLYAHPDAVVVQNPVTRAGAGRTAIAKALRKCTEIFEEFIKDDTLPDEKYCTVFLFTDGNDDVSGDNAVRNAAEDLKTHFQDVSIEPSLATIAFGSKADESLLQEIASSLSERQKRHLRHSLVLNQLPNKDKMFIQGHSQGIMTHEIVESLKRFVWVLSTTI